MLKFDPVLPMESVWNFAFYFETTRPIPVLFYSNRSLKWIIWPGNFSDGPCSWNVQSGSQGDEHDSLRNLQISNIVKVNSSSLKENKPCIPERPNAQVHPSFPPPCLLPSYMAPAGGQVLTGNDTHCVETS